MSPLRGETRYLLPSEAAREKKLGKIAVTQTVRKLTVCVTKSVLVQLPPVAIKVAAHLAEAVAAKLFDHGPRDNQGNHCFADHARRGHRGDVRTFEGCCFLLLGVDVH